MIDPAQVRALLEELGDLAAASDPADPQHRALLYQEMGITGVDRPPRTS